MARICEELQAAIDRGDITPVGLTGAEHRRDVKKWVVLGCRLVIEATVERMNRRARLGRGFEAEKLEKTARRKIVVTVKNIAEVVATTAAALPTLGAGTSPSKASVKIRHACANKNCTGACTDVLKPAVTPPPTQPTAPLSQRVILVIDESGSMRDFGKPAAIHNQLDAIAKTIRNEMPAATVSTLLFGTTLDHRGPFTGASFTAPTLTANMGGTALYDAVQEAVRAALVDESRPTLVYLLTDGEANLNLQNQPLAAAAVKHALATQRVTFACVGPASAANFFKGCGIPVQCIRQWDGISVEDLQTVSRQAQQGTQSFAEATRSGKTKVDKFFLDVVAAQTNIAAVRKELRDVSSAFRRREIGTFCEVRKYVQDVLKRDYVPGAAYYQFGAKQEELKAGRRVLIQPRGSKELYGGPAARRLLGLPEDRDCLVEVKNLGEFLLFVQSASPNRKLLPGTAFYYDESHVDGATKPTWERAISATRATKGVK